MPSVLAGGRAPGQRPGTLLAAAESTASRPQGVPCPEPQEPCSGLCLSDLLSAESVERAHVSRGAEPIRPPAGRAGCVLLAAFTLCLGESRKPCGENAWVSASPTGSPSFCPPHLHLKPTDLFSVSVVSPLPECHRVEIVSYDF